MKSSLSLLATLALGAGIVGSAPAIAQDEVGACLITKTDINPFFVKMKEGASAKAEELGITCPRSQARLMAIMKPKCRRLKPALLRAPKEYSLQPPTRRQSCQW